MPNHKMKVETYCEQCGEPQSFEVPPEFNDDLERWKSGTHIQKALPYLTPGQREMFMTGICESCHGDAFSPEAFDLMREGNSLGQQLKYARSVVADASSLLDKREEVARAQINELLERWNVHYMPARAIEYCVEKVVSGGEAEHVLLEELLWLQKQMSGGE